MIDNVIVAAAKVEAQLLAAGGNDVAVVAEAGTAATGGDEAHVIVGERAIQLHGDRAFCREGVTQLALGRAKGSGIVAVGDGDMVGTSESVRICCTDSDLLWSKEAVAENNGSRSGSVIHTPGYHAAILFRFGT